MKKLLLPLLLLCTSSAMASVTIQSVDGWFESGYVTWSPVEGADNYHVYYKAAEASDFTLLDSMLVRNYGTYGRADVLGIKAGSYQFKVVPVANGQELTAEATVTKAWEAAAYNRDGFAHFKTASSTFDPKNGVGAYKNDGTLKAGAKVFYVHAGNAKTISTEVVTNAKGAKTTGTGMQAIISLYEKGFDKTPLDFRIIGKITAENMDALASSEEGLQIKGKEDSELNITIEGVGNDATIHGFGILMRGAASVEIRNLGVLWCLDDGISMDTDNSNIWVHNLDVFYGKQGSGDKAKGDGCIDVKANSKFVTVAYNHIWDGGKSSMCGMKSESGPNYITYHHNWFDHSDSRHPRIRTMSVHVYNNYFDGVAKYGVGVTTGANAFVENNYFRNCKYPMLISKQGSDINNGVGTSDQTKGTFSGENGGVIKAFGNYITGATRFQPYDASSELNSVHFDAYVASSREEQVPATVKALLGGTSYSNFDTDAAVMYSGYHCDKAEDVPAEVTGKLGAGRCQHGDFTWTFDNSTEDKNAEIIPELSAAIKAYQSSLVGFFGNGGNVNDNPNPNPNPNVDPDPNDNPDPDPNPNPNDNPNEMEGTVVCSFSQSAKTPSSSMVVVSGNYSNSKGTLSYGGTSYTDCVKMETATNIKITPTANCTVTLIFDTASKGLYLDGTKYKTDSNGQYSFKATANTTYVLTKGDSMNLFLILFTPDEDTAIEEVSENLRNARFYDLQGRPVKQLKSGTYICNGTKKLIVKS